MNIDAYLEVAAEAFVMEGLVKILPPDSDWRELSIQIQKLQRMIRARSEIKLGTSAKKNKLRLGKHDAAIGRQLKHVRGVAKQSFKEWKRSGKPELTNREFEVWQKDFRGAVNVQAKGMVLKMKQLAASK